jgi:hypothetical protein
MPDSSDYSDFWKKKNNDAKDSRIVIRGEQDKKIELPNFDFYCQDKSIKEYRFENCIFNGSFEFIFKDTKDINFVFESCEFSSTLSFNKEKIEFAKDSSKLSSVIYFWKCIIKEDGELSFKGNFDNRIYIRDINLENYSNINFISSDREISKYSEIIINNINIIESSKQRYINSELKREISFNDIEIDILNMEKVEINSLILKGITIKSSLLLDSKYNFEKTYSLPIEILELDNVDFLEKSKIKLKFLKLNQLKLNKISQDVKFMQFDHIKVLNNLEFNQIEFKNTYFNDFDISKAKKKIEKTSFIDSSLNSVDWGNISKIEASHEMFRQLKFVNDSQGNYLKVMIFMFKRW